MEEPKPTPRRSPKKFIIWTLVVLLVAAGGAGAYYHLGQVKTLNDQKASLDQAKAKLQTDLKASQAQTTSLKATNTDLQKQIEQLKAPASPEKVSLAVTTKGSQRWGQDQLLKGNAFLLVDITVKNPGKQVAYLSLGDFKLKDDSSNVFPLYSQSAVGSQPRYLSGVDNLPDNKIELRSQSLGAGESVSGTLIFYVRDDIAHFTLSRDAQTFSLNP